MAVTPEYTTEENLIEKQQGEIAAFWRTGDFHSFDGVDDITIKYAHFTSPKHQRNLVIIQGRSESYLKYKELAYDLFQQGYNIFLLDHRGQGLSGRMLANPHKGYVGSFDDYAEDLHTFISVHVLPYCDEGTKPYLLAHSMGCAITCLYLAKYSSMVQAVAFSAPMFAVDTAGIPKKVAASLIYCSSFIEKIFTHKPWYFPGQRNHYFKPFAKNRLSHSAIRYQVFKQLYQQETELQLGGVTTHWLKLAYKVTPKIFAILPQISAPILVIQAGDERIVDNQVQNEFCDKLHQLNAISCPNGKPEVIKDAWHELFFEKDSYRQQAITLCLNWFEQHS